VNASGYAIRLGVQRGWLEFTHSIRSRQDWAYYLFTAAASTAYLWVRRNDKVDDSGLLVPAASMPGIVALLATFGLLFGTASIVVGSREDGTLLRAKAIPNGLIGFVAGQLVTNTLNTLPQLTVVVVPGLILFDDIMSNGLTGWIQMTGILLLGLASLLPLGLAVGAVVPTTQKLFSWGMLAILFLAVIFGVFFPIQSLWGWLQGVGQAFPLYWFGLGLREAFLPESAAASELQESWRTTRAVIMLSAWAVAGLLAAPILLQRVARRQSGSQVEAARLAATHWVR
jgi:ABC-2 type transport system permease protein